MLQSNIIRAEAAGTAELIVDEEGIAVGKGAPLIRIKETDGKLAEIHAPEDARIEMLAVPDGANVQAGDELIVLAPSTEQVWESLRALYLVGLPEDIPAIQHYAHQVSGMPDHVQKQANITVAAIRARAQGK